MGYSREQPETIKGGIEVFSDTIRKKMKTLTKQIHVISELMSEKQRRHEEINNYKIKSTSKLNNSIDIDLEISRTKTLIEIAADKLKEHYKRLRELEIAKNIREESSNIMKTKYMIVISNSAGKTFTIVEDKNDYDESIEMLYFSR